MTPFSGYLEPTLLGQQVIHGDRTVNVLLSLVPDVDRFRRSISRHFNARHEDTTIVVDCGDSFCGFVDNCGVGKRAFKKGEGLRQATR